MRFLKGEDMILKDKVCLITGTSRGIGASILNNFAKEGAVIYANARETGCIDDKAKYLEDKYECLIKPVYFDICDSKAVKLAIKNIQEEQGRLDVLVNNAGIMKDALIGMASKDLMREIFETNVFASMDLLQLASRLMKRKRNGSIINFSSIVGKKWK